MNPHTPYTHSPQSGEVCLLSTTQQRYFRNPLEIYTTSRIDEVMALLETIDMRVRDEGLYAAGYVAYEAASAFDEALFPQFTGDFSTPLVWFGLYDSYEEVLPESVDVEVNSLEWTPGISQSEFDASIGAIHEHIAAGNTYQVNYTFPLGAHFSGDTYAWFRRICAAQRGDYCCYIETDTHTIMSFSPELFFTLNGSELVTKPMKGTLHRGLYPEADAVQALALEESVKNRAENLMIVDLLRNDMGRVAETGSVRVSSLFDVTPYDRLWQMTSTIRATTHVEVPDIFKALFPCGSVTGAPKVMTSKIIQDLESYSRGAYCGAIGYWGPGREAEFNVAIRTATLDKSSERLTYPIGAGITWDSCADTEYEECLLKAAVVTHPKPSFELLETLLWNGHSYDLLDRHLQRLIDSAAYFGIAIDEGQLLRGLSDMTKPNSSHGVRLLVNQSGQYRVSAFDLGETDLQQVRLAEHSIDSSDVFLYHKTSQRDVYSLALKDMDCDDVILWNERGELTETTRANLVLKLDGQWLTPPISSGLLAGTCRAELLEHGTIRESVLYKEDLKRVESIALINSVRGWMDAQLIFE